MVLILTDLVCVPQDLKEKKLLEEKENGKGAATNGKVHSPPGFFVSLCGPGLIRCCCRMRRTAILRLMKKKRR